MEKKQQKETKKPEKKEVKEDLQDLLKRVQADFDNYRRRTEQEREGLKKIYLGAFVEKLIPIIDHFELALQHECSDKNYAIGMEMIHKLLIELLKNEGITQENPVGEEFNPTKHEAIEKKSEKETKNNYILSVTAKGYLMQDKIIRRAKVVVNSHEEE